MVHQATLAATMKIAGGDTAMARRASRSNSAGVWCRASGKVDGYSMCIDRFMMEGYLLGVCRASHPAPEGAGQGGKTYMAPTPNARKQIARLLERAKCLIPMVAGAGFEPATFGL
jgi:hypothetical protein